MALLGAAAVTSVTAQAVEISNGAFTGIFYRDCRSAAAKAAGSTVPDMCEVNGDYGNTLIGQNWSNSLGGSSSSTSAAPGSPPTMGSLVSKSSVTVSDTLGGLTIKQQAYSGTPYTRVSSQSTALQSYHWDGSGSAQRSVTGSLDFTTFGSLPFDSNGTGPATLVEGYVSVYSLATSSFDFEPADAAVGSYELSAKIRADYRSEALDSQTGLSSPYQFGVSFTMQAGRTYFVESWLGVFVRYGGWGDASHTFKVNLDDVEGLTAAAPLDAPLVVSSVPEPATAALYLGGLLLLAGRLLRRDHRHRGR
jgi:hypothetical protein